MTKKITLLFLLFVICYASLAQSVTIQADNNTSCGEPNGAIHVSIIGGEVIDYSFEWRKNGQILNPVTILGYAAGSSSVSLVNLSSGFYSVKVTNNSNSSIVGIMEITLEDVVQIPELSVQPVSNTSCAVNYNGTLTASVTNGEAADHSFTWYDGEGTGGSIIGNSATLTQLAGGYYTVKVTNLMTACVSVVGATVSDEPAVPAVMVNTTSNTNCGSSPNGSLTASTEGPAAQYTFAWYEGLVASGQVVSANATLTNVTGGNYTVKVTGIGTGCSATVTGQVANDYPEGIVIEKTDNTSCGVPNGSLSASVSCATSGYTFEWYAGTNTSGPVLSTGPVATALSAGTYTLRVTDNSSSSEVGVVQTMVLDVAVLPMVEIGHTPNTSCVDLPNGSLTATVTNGNASDHSFNWYQNGNLIGTGSTLIQVGSGMYSIQVTNLITSCSTESNITIADAPAVPEVTVNTTSNTTCGSSPNGSLTASTEGSPAQYTFEWYAGVNASGDVLSTNATLTNVAAGNYTVRVISVNTGCSATVTAEVVDDCQNIIVGSVDNTSCGVPNGSASASVNGSTSGYTFNWYAGLNASGDVLTSGAVATGLSAGNYSVRVIKQSNSSEIGIVQVMVADATQLPQVVVQSTSNSSCTVNANGSLTALPEGGAGDHSFAWYQGVNAEGDVIGTSSTLTGVSAGTYTVKVTNNNTSCITITGSTISDEPATPPVVTVTTINNTDCFSSTPNGSLTAASEGPASQYTFEWYDGVNTSGETLASSATLSDVAAATYTVKVVDITTGCESVVSAQVADNCELITGNVTNKGETSVAFSYYPNPATTTFNIVSKVNATLSLIDIHGTTIFKRNVSASAEPSSIDLSGVKPGMYVLRVRNGKRTMHYQVVVK